jgi:hypothetical protein
MPAIPDLDLRAKAKKWKKKKGSRVSKQWSSGSAILGFFMLKSPGNPGVGAGRVLVLVTSRWSLSSDVC